MPQPIHESLGDCLQRLRAVWGAVMGSPRAWTDVQQRSIATLALHIQRLSSLIDELPQPLHGLSSSTRHDLRNELTVILGYTQLLLHKRIGLADTQEAALLTNLIKIGEQINQILEQDRQESPFNRA